MEFEEAIKFAKKNIGSIITRDENGDFIFLLKGPTKQIAKISHKDIKTDSEKEKYAFNLGNETDINQQIEAMWSARELTNMDKEQQIEEMWASYESEIRKYKNSFEAEKLEFASSDDVRKIIEEEIEEKFQYIEANECRAYITSTF